MPRSLTWSGDRYELLMITSGFDEGKNKVLNGGRWGGGRQKEEADEISALKELQYRGPARSLSLASSSVDIHLLSSVRPISSCHKDKSYGIFRPSFQFGPVKIRRLIIMQSIRPEQTSGQDSQPRLPLWRKLLMAVVIPIPSPLASIPTFPLLLVLLSLHMPCWLFYPIPRLPRQGE